MKNNEYIKFEEMITDSSTESDRSCALILAANLDNRLIKILSNFFVNCEKTSQSILSGNGYLSTFSSRIQLTYALGFLSKKEDHDLNLIRKIRNIFAHEESGIDFNHEKIKGLCSSIEMIKDMKTQYPNLADLVRTPREQFQISAASLSLILMDRVITAEKERRTVNEGSSILPKK